MIYFHIPLDRSEKRLYNTCKRNAYRHIVRCQIDGNYPVGGTESVENREILYEYQDNRFVLEQQNGWYSKWTNYFMVKKIIVVNGRLCLPDSYRGNVSGK